MKQFILYVLFGKDRKFHNPFPTIKESCQFGGAFLVLLGFTLGFTSASFWAMPFIFLGSALIIYNQ